MRFERRTYAGVVLEREVYSAGNPIQKDIDIEKKLKKPKTEEEKKAANVRHSLKLFTRTINETFAEGGLYVTMTYDNKHLPSSRKEAEHTADLYIRRILYKFPKAKIILVTGFGTKSGRLHHHMIVQGVHESYIVKKWRYGLITRIEPLRAHNIYNGKDHGRDYTALAIYLHRHSADKEKGRRWKQTKSVTRPEPEKPKEVRRSYSIDKPPKAPKGYELVEAREGISGYLYFKYVKTVEKRKRANALGSDL